MERKVTRTLLAGRSPSRVRKTKPAAARAEQPPVSVTGSIQSWRQNHPPVIELLLCFRESLGKRFVAESELQLSSVIFGAGKLSFAVVAAEGNLRAGKLNRGALVQVATTEGASLLSELLGRNQLMVRFLCELCRVSLELSNATTAAEINLAAFVLNNLAGCSSLGCYNTFDAFQIDLSCNNGRGGDKKDGESA